MLEFLATVLFLGLLVLIVATLVVFSGYNSLRAFSESIREA
ncbi:MAG: hypothetical protein Q6K99_03855 [Thermostichales cyanobacterium BF4_bins_65]